MTRRSHLRASARLVAVVLVAALFAASCSGADPAVIETTQAPDDATVATAAATTGGTLALPSVEVVDLVTNADIDLATYSPPGPTLVWFWAPT